MSEDKFKYDRVPVPDGRIEVAGKIYMSDTKGALLPIEVIKAQHLLEDQMVRDQFSWFLGLREQVRRYRGHLYSDLGQFDDIIAEKYGATKGGPKGNRTYSTIDDLFRISVRVRDQIDFGPELQSAKALFDECVRDWTADSNAPLRAFVTNAFDIDKEGKINKSELFRLLRQENDDPRWQAAMLALKDAIRITGSRTSYEFKMRGEVGGEMVTVSFDLAKA